MAVLILCESKFESMDEDELMEVNQQDQTPASPIPAAQSGSKPNSPARKVASSTGASPVAPKPASPAKSTEASKAASAVGVGKASNPSSPAMQNASLANSPQGMQSPQKSPVKSSSPAVAHSDDDDFFKYLDFSKSSPPKPSAVPLEQYPKPSASVTTSPPPKSTVIEHGGQISQQSQFNSDRLLWEQQAHVFENQLVDLSSQLKALQAEKKEWTDKFSKQSQETELLKSRLKEKETVLNQVTTEKQETGQRTVQLDQERQTLTASILNKDLEILRLSEDLEKSTSKILELKQELRVEKEKVSDVQSNELSLKATLASNEHELAQAVKMSSWLNTELETKSNEFIAYRKEKVDQIKSLQLGLEESAQEKNGLEVRANLLQKRADDLESKLSAKMDSLQEAQNARIMSEQQFKNEMTAQKKLTDLYLGKSQELGAHNQELETLVRELETKVIDLNRGKEESALEFQNQLQAQKKVQDDQEVELEQLRSQIKLINTDMNLEKQADQVAQLSQTAAAASRFQKTGKSFTQVYSDYTALQQDYIREKSEVARLTECLNHIVSEFEQRAPIIQKTNEEYQKARDQIENMSIELSNAIREKAEAVAQFKKIKSAMQEVEASQALLEKDIEDRNRQLQAVLREHEILKGAHPSSLPSIQEPELSHLSAADAIISKRLVVFKNIEELQSHNQALLRSIRSLSAKMETQDRANEAQADEARLEALNESTKLIERLQEQLKRETLNSESFAKERDQWRRIAETRGARQNSPGRTTPAASPEPKKQAAGGPDYESFYRDLQREFDVYRKESGTDTKMLKTQLEKSQEEKTNLSIQVAKLNNQISYLNERHELLVQSTLSKEKEATQLRERLSSINDTATRQDIKIEELANSLLQARQSMESVNAENQQYKIERQIWKSSEARVLKESQDFLKERNAANDRIRELQDALDESDRKSGTKLKRMEDQVEELNRDLQLSRKQLTDVIDDHRTLSSKRDAELRESQIKMERMTIDFERAKGELALAVNKEQNATLRVQELIVKVTALEQKSLIYDGRPRRAEGAASGVDGELSDLQSELRQVQIELASAKAELVVAKDQSDAFKVISQASEDRLVEMNSTYEVYKLEMEQKITDLNSTIENLEADKADMQLKLTKLGESLRETQETMDSQLEEFNSAKSLYERQIVTLKENEEAANKSVSAMKLDLSRQAKEAQACQAKYEQEVVNHSLSLQQVASMKTANESVAKSRDDALLALQSASDKLIAVQSSFDSVKGKLESDIADLEIRVEDLKIQNTLLHSQFEQLSICRAQFVSESVEGFVPSGNEGVATEDGQAAPSIKAVADLGEVIKFLRREKEIVETKLQISIQENERSRLHLDQLQKSLDESRALLDEERKKSQEIVGSERKHIELLEKIEQTNILRESNITLRSQLEISQKKLDQLDKKLKETEVQLEPLKGQVSQLESEVEARKAESKALVEDNGRWKDRAQQILEKYNRIDPVEHENLKTSVATLTEAKGLLEAQLASQQTDVGSQVAEKELQIKSLVAEIKTLKDALEEKENLIVSLRDPETNDEMIALSQDLQAAKAKNKKIIKEANEKIKAKSEKVKELLGEIAELKAQQTEQESMFEVKIQETQTRLDTVRQAEIKRLTESLERKYELQLKSLQATLQSVQAAAPVHQVAAPLATAQTSSTSSATLPIHQTPTPKRTREPDTEANNSIGAGGDSQSPHAKRIRVVEAEEQHPVNEVENDAVVAEEDNRIPAESSADDHPDLVIEEDEQEEAHEDFDEAGNEDFELEEGDDAEENEFEGEEGEEYEDLPEPAEADNVEEMDEDVVAAAPVDIAAQVLSPTSVKQALAAEEDDDLINIGTPDASFEPADPDLIAGDEEVTAAPAVAPVVAPVVAVAKESPVVVPEKSVLKSPVAVVAPVLAKVSTDTPPKSSMLPPEVVIKPVTKISIKPPPTAPAAAAPSKVVPSSNAGPSGGGTKVTIRRKITPTTEAPSNTNESDPAAKAASLKDQLLKMKLLKEKANAGAAQAATNQQQTKAAVGRINRQLAPGAGTRGGRGGISIRGRGRGRGQQAPPKQG